MGSRPKRLKGRMAKHRRSAAGVPPPDPSSKQAHPPKISLVAYGPDGVDEHTDVKPEALAELRAKRPVMWVDVDGFGDPEVIDRVGKVLDLHPLALEDA